MGMDPAEAAQQYQAWEQYYAQGGQQQSQPPDSSGYKAYFEGRGQESGGYQEYRSGKDPSEWQRSGEYVQTSYNNVAPPRSSFRGNDRGGRGFNRGRGYGDRGSSSRGGYHDRNSSRGNYHDRNSSGGYQGRSDGYQDRRAGNSYDNYGSGSGDNQQSGGFPNKMIFVSGLPQHANETFIHDVFANEGAIEINESNGKPKIKIYQDHGVSKGECTISFVDEATAQKVVSTMNGQTFPGTENVMQISMAKFSGARSGGGFDRGGRGGFRDRGGFNRDGRDNDFGRNSRGNSGGNFRNDRPDNGGGYERRGRDNDFGENSRGGGNFRNDRSDNGDGYDRRGRGRGRGGGFDGNRGRGRGGNAQVREGDWMCPCGNNNFAFRRECNSCKAPRGADSGDNSGGGQMRGHPRSQGDNRHRPY